MADKRRLLGGVTSSGFEIPERIVRPAASVCGIAAAAIKGGTFKALTAASAAFAGAAAMWGYTNKRAGKATAPVLSLPGPLNEEGDPRLVLATWDAYATTDGRHSLTHPTRKPDKCFAVEI
jgi:hypothetical protein